MRGKKQEKSISGEREDFSKPISAAEISSKKIIPCLACKMPWTILQMDEPRSQLNRIND